MALKTQTVNCCDRCDKPINGVYWNPKYGWVCKSCKDK